MTRDLDAYTEHYSQLPFEAIQASYRRRLVLSRVAKHRPKSLLEIGCGELPLFTNLDNVVVTVVEPAAAFAERARELARERSGVTVLEACAEQVPAPVSGGTGGFDMIVVSCLLHEVEDAQALLAAVRRQCRADTVVHVNVPNAQSLHRLLAVSMGLIQAPDARSETQRVMQQRAVYDRGNLETEISRAGFKVFDRGSLFVKPFAHSQMQYLVDTGFLTPLMLDGLGSLTDLLPDLGSEIWVEATPEKSGHG